MLNYHFKPELLDSSWCLSYLLLRWIDPSYHFKPELLDAQVRGTTKWLNTIPSLTWPGVILTNLNRKYDLDSTIKSNLIQGPHKSGLIICLYKIKKKALIALVFSIPISLQTTSGIVNSFMYIYIYILYIIYYCLCNLKWVIIENSHYMEVVNFHINENSLFSWNLMFSFIFYLSSQLPSCPSEHLVFSLADSFFESSVVTLLQTDWHITFFTSSFGVSKLVMVSYLMKFNNCAAFTVQY